MNMRVRGLQSTQQGLITRRQAVELGMSPEQVDRLVRTKVWKVVRKGVYAEAALVSELSSLRERRLLTDRAVSLRITSPHVMSHHSSAYRWQLEVLNERPDPLTHVTRLGIVGSHQRPGVKHHRAPYLPHQVVDIDGVACLDPARTACDIAREQGFRQGLVAADSALRIGATAADLAAAAKAMTHWPWVSVVDDVVASCAADTDSIGETLTRELVTELGHGVPQVQFGLAADGRVAWCDLRLGRHVIEFDGRMKYQRVDEGGVADTDPGSVVWQEKQREDWVRGFRLGVSRVVWDELFGPRRQATLERLQREYLETCRLYGTDISDLAQYRPRVPRPRRQPAVPWVRAAA